MVLKLSPAKYGKLLSRQMMPKRIETDAEMDHFVEVMEGLQPVDCARRSRPRRNCAAFPARHTRQGIRRSRLSASTRRSIRPLQFLMEQRGLRAADLTPVFGRALYCLNVSQREAGTSKAAYSRKLADFSTCRRLPFWRNDPLLVDPAPKGEAIAFKGSDICTKYDYSGSVSLQL